MLQVMETCRTVKLRHGKGRPRLAFARRPQRVLYYYFLDPEFGLMHVRLQTWFPFTVQVYVNGHDWLARQMLHQKFGFVQRDNAFTQLDEPVVAQRLADRFPKLPWVKILNRWVRRVNPLLGRSWSRQGRLLLGHRPGRVQHRCLVPESSQVGRTLSATATARPVALLGPGHPHLPGPPSARAL